MGIVRIDRYGTVDLCLRLFVSLMENMDAAKNHMRAHFGIIEAQRLARQFLGAFEKGGGDSAQPIAAAMW